MPATSGAIRATPSELIAITCTMSGAVSRRAPSTCVASAGPVGTVSGRWLAVSAPSGGTSPANATTCPRTARPRTSCTVSAGTPPCM